MLEVMMMMVFLKLMKRPLLSVSRPSSSTWSRMLNTSGFGLFDFVEKHHGIRFASHSFCELALSRNRRIPEALRPDGSRNASPCTPTYRSGSSCHRRRRDTPQEPWQASVLPTPVVPRKIKVPMGRRGSLSPARAAHGISDCADGVLLSRPRAYRFFLERWKFLLSRSEPSS